MQCAVYSVQCTVYSAQSTVYSVQCTVTTFFWHLSFSNLPSLVYADDYEPTMGTIKKVSEELSAILSLRVAALVMLLVIVMPFLSYEVTDYSEAAWLLNFRVMAKNENVTADDISYSARRCEKFYYNKNTDLVKLTVESPWLPPPYYSENLETRNPLRQVYTYTPYTPYTHYTPYTS